MEDKKEDEKIEEVKNEQEEKKEEPKQEEEKKEEVKNEEESKKEEPKQEEEKKEEEKKEEQPKKEEEKKEEEPKKEEPKKEEPKKEEAPQENKPPEQKQNNEIKPEQNQPKKEPPKPQNPPAQTQKINKEENDKIVNIIKEKIKKLNSLYNFCLQYEDVIYKILLNLDESTYDKINNSFTDYFSYLNFFKSSSELYSKFAEQIQNTNKIITFEQKPKMSDNFLSNIMQNTQNIFYQNLSKFSAGLRTNIISKGPLSQMAEKKSKIETFKKTQLKKFSELIDERKLLEKKYKTYNKLFISFVPELVENQLNKNIVIEPMPDLIDAPDFVIIVKDLLESINKLINKITTFIKEAKESMNEINKVYIEVAHLIKDSISIYMQESKIFFNSEITKKFEEIENYFKKYEQTSNENKYFLMERIFPDEKSKNNIFNLLQNYYTLLTNSNTVKKELLTDRNAFSVQKYSNIMMFYNWLISVQPCNVDVTVDDLIIKKMEIKRDPGLFSKWKQAGIVFTRQSHLILFDKVDSFKNEDVVKIFEMDKISFKRKEDKKKGLLFDIIANVKGKVMNFKGEHNFDALTMDNLNEISGLIKDHV